jgi:hypothetical protein
VILLRYLPTYLPACLRDGWEMVQVLDRPRARVIVYYGSERCRVNRQRAGVPLER